MEVSPNKEKGWEKAFMAMKLEGRKKKAKSSHGSSSESHRGQEIVDPQDKIKTLSEEAKSASPSEDAQESNATFSEGSNACCQHKVQVTSLSD